MGDNARFASKEAAFAEVEKRNQQASYNYVIFSDKDVSIEERFQRARKGAAREEEPPEGFHEMRTVTRAAEGEPFRPEAEALRDSGENLAPNFAMRSFVDKAYNDTLADPVKALEDVRATMDTREKAAKIVGWLNAAKQKKLDTTSVLLEASQDLSLAGTILRTGRELNLLTPEGRARLHMAIVNEFAKKRGFVIGKANKERLEKMFADAEAVTDDRKRMMAIHAAFNWASERMPFSWMSFWDLYRYNNMLSNPRATKRNVMTNIFNTFIAIPAMHTGRGGWTTYMSNAAKGIGDASSAFMDAMRQAPDFSKGAETVDSGDMSAAYMRTKMPKAISWWVRFMDAQDIFCGSLIEAGETARLVQRGYTPANAEVQAKKLAEEFLNRRRLGKDWKDTSLNQFVRALDAFAFGIERYRTSGPAIARYPLKMLVAFLRTPIDWTKMQINMSPLAFLAFQKVRTEDGKLRLQWGLTRKAIGQALFPKVPSNRLSADQKAQIDYEYQKRMAMGLMGTMATAIGGAFAMTGMTTWAPPKDEEARREFYGSGRVPYSLTIGGRHVPLWYFGPFALSLAIPAAIRDAFYDDPSLAASSAATKLISIFPKLSVYLLSESPLMGYGKFIDIINGEGGLDYKTMTSAGFAATQFIPLSGLVRWINEWIDPVYRKPTGTGLKPFVDQLKSGIPYLSKQLEPIESADEGKPARRTAADILAPFSIRKTVPEHEIKYQTRMQELRQRRINDAQVDDMVTQIRAGKFGVEPLIAFLGGLPKEEESRLRANINRKYEDIYSQIGNDFRFGLDFPDLDRRLTGKGR
jgi:hypothetical protein